jgi:tetratricopeptide (TPR) repeat protein
MAHVVRSFDRRAAIPENEDEFRGLYLSVLSGKRALLLMDNARGREQVEPLIPPSGCLLLVTSRDHFTLPGLHAIELKTLPPEDARKLLLKIAPRIGDHADAIAKLCGYLPEALRPAASTLAERADLSPADYVMRLEESRTRLEFVDASLTLSYDLLDPELQEGWRALAVFPETFDVEAAAAVWEVEPDEARDTLGGLLRYSMVEWDEASGRYRLHDLARLFASSRLSEVERTAARRRHAEHYREVLALAGDLYLEGVDDLMRGLTLFDLEWPNIQAGQAWAAAHAEKDDEAARLCSSYAGAGVYVLDLRQHPRQQIQWLEAALAAARRLNDREAEARHLGNLGTAYQRLGETRRAIENHEQVLEIMRVIGNRRGEGTALGNLGIAYAELGELQRAIKYHEQSLDISREIGDREGEGRQQGNLGSTYLRLGELQRAIDYCVQQLEITREIGGRRGEGNALGNLGSAYTELGDPRRAVGYYEQQLEIAREIGDLLGEGIALWNTAVALDELGDRTQAIENANAALVICEQIEDPHADMVRERLEEWRKGK